MFTFLLGGPPQFLTTEYMAYMDSTTVYYASVDLGGGSIADIASSTLPASNTVAMGPNYIYSNAATANNMVALKYDGTATLAQEWDDAVENISNAPNDGLLYSGTASTGHVFATGCGAFGHGLSAIPVSASAAGTAVNYEVGDDTWTTIMDFRDVNNGGNGYGDVFVMGGTATADATCLNWTGSAWNLRNANAAIHLRGGSVLGWDRDSGAIVTNTAEDTSVALYTLNISTGAISSVGAGTTTHPTVGATYAGGYLVTYEDATSGGNRVVTYSQSGTTLTEIDAYQPASPTAAIVNEAIVTSPFTDAVYCELGCFTVAGDGTLTRIALPRTPDHSATYGDKFAFSGTALPSL